MALRGRFLVGSRPVGGEFVSRFVASAAESGIDVFRLHDPLNDVENLREAGEAITSAGKEFDAGLVFGSGYTNETEALVEQARKLPARRLARASARPVELAPAAPRAGARRDAQGGERPAGRPLLPGRGRQRDRRALEAARAGADLVACAVYPVALTAPPDLGRGARDRARRARARHRVDVPRSGGPRSSSTSTSATSPSPRSRRGSPCAPRSTRFRPGSSPRSTPPARAGAGDRLDEVLDELAKIREEVGLPPIASPIGQILGSQALLHVLSASRYQTVSTSCAP